MSQQLSCQKFQQIFKVYDQKRTGQIRTQQITKLIRSARLFPSQQDIQRLMKLADPNLTGYFNITKFVDIGMQFAIAQSKINHEEQLLKAFSFFDQSNRFIKNIKICRIKWIHFIK